MKIGFAQINSTVGDLAGNQARILSAYRQLEEAGADIVLTPELALTGYPPLDLLFKSRFVPDNLAALDSLAKNLGRAALVVGFVEPNQGVSGKPFHNAAAVLQSDRERVVIHKTLIPTYDVFSEARYFEPGTRHRAVTIKGQTFGVTICEDIWPPEFLHRPLYAADPIATLIADGAESILNLSASPFQIGKPNQQPK